MIKDNPIDLVLEEMQKIEEEIIKRNMSFYEEVLFEHNSNYLEEKFNYRDGFFDKIRWYQVGNKKADRSFTFYKDGKIDFYRGTPSENQVHVSCNVMSEDVSINSCFKENDERFSLSLKNNILYQQKGNFEIKTNLDTQENAIIYNKFYKKYSFHIPALFISLNSKPSASLAIFLNPEGYLDRISIDVYTRKSNGHINGNCRFTAYNAGNNIDFKFIHRKGTKDNLLDDNIKKNIKLMFNQPFNCNIVIPYIVSLIQDNITLPDDFFYELNGDYSKITKNLVNLAKNIKNDSLSPLIRERIDYLLGSIARLEKDNVKKLNLKKYSF